MKNKFFSFKRIMIVFLILLGASMVYLSSMPTPHIQEIEKEIQINKQ
jgi:hypothetical protein